MTLLRCREGVKEFINGSRDSKRKLEILLSRLQDSLEENLRLQMWLYYNYNNLYRLALPSQVRFVVLYPVEQKNHHKIIKS